jgi:hypothetical protein
MLGLIKDNPVAGPAIPNIRPSIRPFAPDALGRYTAVQIQELPT